MSRSLISFLVFFGFLFITGPIGTAYSLDIVWPLHNAYVTKSNYLIIKGDRDPFLEGLSVEINGVKSDVLDLTGEEYRAAFADMLVLEPIFDPGENKVIVEGFLNGKKTVSVDMTVFYHNDMTEPLPVGYEEKFFLLNEREEPCMECHDMQPTVAALADPRAEYSPCGSCHARMLNRDHVHGPAAVYECLYCHDADSTPIKYRPVVNDLLTCGACHENEMQVFNQQKYIHGPVEADMCLVCHDPHASDQPAQLVLEVNTLCLSCHASVDTESHVTAVGLGKSHPVKGTFELNNKDVKLTCVGCHNPHGGESTSYFVDEVVGRMQLCSVCHQK